MIPKLITTRWLKKHKACSSQVVLFSAKWPHGAEPTEANLLQAVEMGLDLSWFAMKLPRPLLAEYKRQDNPLLAEYERQDNLLLAECERQRALLGAEYERQQALLLAHLMAQAAEGGLP